MNSTTHDKSNDDILSLESIEVELAKFEADERVRLGLPMSVTKQWFDAAPCEFTAAQRAHTTILVSGLTTAHDLFVQSALAGIGYQVRALDVPDNEALQYGREYGNRGQCNPTYFTVGNLVKHLERLRTQGMRTEEIVSDHVFLTAGACGPCRFGTYVTEYRKALRDSGFDGFRVLLFQQTGGLKQATGDQVGLKIDPQFFWAIARAIFIGDALNALGYRVRPYEVDVGATDRALEQAKSHIAGAFATGGSLVKALYRARMLVGAVAVDKLRVKPKVGIIGEFWAMTTEGDGNYGLQRFLEGEGAEVDIQLVASWILYLIWQGRYDTTRRSDLRGTDRKQSAAGGSKFSLEGVDVRKRMVLLWAAEKALRALFGTIAKALGLNHYHLPDMNQNAEISHAFYDNSVRGGEGHMEIGKLIQNVAYSKVNMTLSVKPFGCMPSSSVSDGVQSLITELYPHAIFLSIETTGDGAVNVYSRVQMQLFKAKQAAQREVDTALDEVGMTLPDVQAYLASHPALNHPFHRSPQRAGSAAADLIYEVGARRHALRHWKNTVVEAVTRRAATAQHAAHDRVLVVARRAAEKTMRKRSIVVAPAADDQSVERWRDAPAGRKLLKVIN